MNAGEFCNRTVSVVTPSETVLEAARRMREHHVGCLVVVEDRDGARVPVGLVTDRDVAVAVAAHGAPPANIEIRSVMTDRVVTALEREDLYSVIKKMRAKGVRRIPVVDAADRLQGIIAADDVLELLAEQLTDLTQIVFREISRERNISSEDED